MQEVGSMNSKRWLEQLEEAGVQFVILDPRSDGDLLQVLQSQAGWTVDFDDPEAVIFAAAASTTGSPDKLACLSL